MTMFKSSFYGAFLLCALLLPEFASADDTLWNMPYARPSKYNYSNYFSADINTYLSANPGYFKARLTSGWNYYKANYLMSTGLIMQMSGIGVNTTTAVSEGIGYGLLLALLNNDQATFNKIFAGANQYMWSSAHNSYFNWKIVNGSVSGTGAATDAELDICMALIFADKLTKFSSVTKWQAYNSGGVTYASRATQMLASIKNNMTSGNFLLPGDNFGGTGLSNLNPSYFATGFLRAFDQYQTTYQFTPVANACYTVLKSRSAQYAKGQAPDWCTSTGGQASNPPSGNYSGLGMTNDAIRVPWRICMDALWFNNTDAIAFCSNSRNTLSQYTSVTSSLQAPPALLQQMTEYTNTMTPDPDAYAGSFHFIAMWLCGAIGSKDAVYAKQLLNGTLVQRVAGQNACFGDPEQSDQYFYYNQSLAMLGFAAFTGMFPNVLADDIKTYIKTTDAPRLSGPAGRFSVKALPGGIGFSLPESIAGRGPVSASLFDVRGKKALSYSFEAGLYGASSRLFIPVGKQQLVPGMYMVKVTVREGDGKTAEYIDRINWK
jgi:endo-1,4-beta-D-glucanase Y